MSLPNIAYFVGELDLGVTSLLILSLGLHCVCFVWSDTIIKSATMLEILTCDNKTLRAGQIKRKSSIN